MDKEIKYCLLGLLLFALLPTIALTYSLIQATSINQVVVIDKEMLFKKFVLELSKRSLSDELMQERTHAFQKNVAHVLEVYAIAHHAVILDKKEVLAISTGRDITIDVMRQVARFMRNTS